MESGIGSIGVITAVIVGVLAAIFAAGFLVRGLDL
jgi:hypothetical protein